MLRVAFESLGTVFFRFSLQFNGSSFGVGVVFYLILLNKTLSVFVHWIKSCCCFCFACVCMYLSISVTIVTHLCPNAAHRRQQHLFATAVLLLFFRIEMYSFFQPPLRSLTRTHTGKFARARTGTHISSFFSFFPFVIVRLYLLCLSRSLSLSRQLFHLTIVVCARLLYVTECWRIILLSFAFNCYKWIYNERQP